MSLKQNSNRLLIIIIGIFISGYVFFFTSPLWLGKGGELVEPTKLFTTVGGTKTEALLCRWNYSAKQKCMEVELEVSNKDLTDSKNFTFIATDRKKGKLKSQIIFHSDNYYVVRINSVPIDWSEISFRVCDEENTSQIYVKLYSNKESIKEVEWIEDLEDSKHLLRHQDDYIQYYTELIKAEEEIIADSNAKISANNESILKLEANTEFQTDKEKETTKQKISTLKNNTETLLDKINGANNNIKEFNERIEMAEKKKAAIMQGEQK